MSYEVYRYPNNHVENVPAMVAMNRNALTANPLFFGETVLTTIVMAGPTQHSANKYSRPSMETENQKFVWTKVHAIIVGMPMTPANIQMRELILK